MSANSWSFMKLSEQKMHEEVETLVGKICLRTKTKGLSDAGELSTLCGLSSISGLIVVAKPQ